MAQSSRKGREGLDTFILSWKLIFAFYVSFVCMLIFFFFFVVHSWAVVLYYKDVAKGAL